MLYFFITKEILDSIKDYSNITLNMSSTPIIEIININREEILDFMINYLQIIVCGNDTLFRQVVVLT